MLSPVVGLRLDDATVTDTDERGALGRPAWGPVGLLRDLTLRLGLPVDDAPAALRVHPWSRRLAALAPGEPFYARSYRVDPVGTAEMLLAWRDGLLDSGWSGAPIPDGGPRLAAFAALESLAAPPLPAGSADRLALAEAALAARDDTPYAALVFADDRALWSVRWRRIFALLAARGTDLGAVPREPIAPPPATDLGRLQALILAGQTAATPSAIAGDGSLLLVRAPTTIEAADAVAAMVAQAGARSSVVVIRSANERLLDDALDAHGLGRLGARGSSRWRPALQVLPLALEQLFAPCDPRRVLELLGLAASPFARLTRYLLSRALCDAPGLGDERWQSAKQRLRDRLAAEPSLADAAAFADRELALVEAWLEPARYDGHTGAPRAAVIAAATRVGDWLQHRASGGDPIDQEALARCHQLRVILASDPRDPLDLLAVRHLLDAVNGAGVSAELGAERVGRPDHVPHPGALLRRRDRVIWWHFTADVVRPPHRARWRRTELAALAACGVVPIEPAALLDEDGRHWRAAVLAARERLWLVLPDTDAGAACAPHPLWDELIARLRIDDAQRARLVVTADDLVAAGVSVEVLAPLALPPARPRWQVAPHAIAAPTRLTAASLQDLLECPLRWVLGAAADLDTSSVPSLPEGPLLDGIFGHRLLQALIASGGLGRPRGELEAAFDRLVPGVAASLLQPGMGFELHQLRHQLVDAATALGAVLRAGGLTVAATEEALDATWLGASLVGRLDLRLTDRAGRDVILDLKWGHGTYRALLAQGRAVQLAAYAHARQRQTGAAALPAAAYFSLSRGRLLAIDGAAFGTAATVDGPALDQVLARIAATLPAVREALDRGVVPVTGVRRSLPLVETLGVAPDLHYTSEPGDGCGYCRFGALCGRAWEALA